MRITNKLNINLSRQEVPEILNAVQGDANTRVVELHLQEGGGAWNVPEGVTAAVAFRKPDGHKGLYDTLPNGAAAVTVAGSVVTATLAPQVLSCAGDVAAAVVLCDKNLNRLATFPFTIHVASDPSAGKTLSNDYYRYSTMEAVSEGVEAALAALEAEKQAFLTDAAPAIVCQATGETVKVTDASNRPLQGLTLYGKTTQNGTPTPETPVPLESAGAEGNITVSVIDGTTAHTQLLTASAPDGFYGIPVSNGGNYTDESGQQWICDEIDFARGVYVRRTVLLENFEKVNTRINTDMYRCVHGKNLIGNDNAASVCTVMPQSAYGYNTADKVHYYCQTNNGIAVVYVPIGFDNSDQAIKVLAALAEPVEMPLPVVPAHETPFVCGGHETLGDSASLPWTDTDSLPPEGNYYLAVDVKLPYSHSISAGKTLNLCLNGHTISAPGEVFHISGGTLNITDCQKIGAEYKGTIQGNTKGHAMNGGVFYLENGSTLNICGGNIQGNASTTKMAYGGVLWVQDSVVNLYDGKISGGNVATKYGGNIYLTSASKLNMYGGAITDGISTGSGGGNVAVNNGSTFNLHGGIVSNGTTTSDGGNIRVAKNSYLMMTGGSVKYGAAQRGGNIYIFDNTAKVTISGGTVTGAASGDNLFPDGGAKPTLGELSAFASLHSNKPNTTVCNDSHIGMRVSYVADTKTYIDSKFAQISAAVLNACQAGE